MSYHRWACERCETVITQFGDMAAFLDAIAAHGQECR